MAKLAKRVYTRFNPQIRSRHPSHNVLRGNLEKLPFKSVIRFGSLTELEDTIANGGKRVELNTTDAIRNSSNKSRMKECFKLFEVKTSEWWIYNTIEKLFVPVFSNNELEMYESKDLSFPIIAKHIYGSRGTGNTMLKSEAELEQWLNGKNLNNYIFEKYYNYNKEYRLHVSENGCFYTCRKMLKQDSKDLPNAWQRHDDNCVWILEENPQFEKPNNWNEIVEHCVKAVQSCGLDFGACDLRVQSNYDKNGNFRENPDFIVVEVNSAPSFGEMTTEKYKEELPKLLKQKYNKINNE